MTATVNFIPGDKVQKIKGYRWPGIVVATFYTLSGQQRIVVECTVPEVAGALHIYSPDQLAKLGHGTALQVERHP